MCARVPCRTLFTLSRREAPSPRFPCSPGLWPDEKGPDEKPVCPGCPVCTNGRCWVNVFVCVPMSAHGFPARFVARRFCRWIKLIRFRFFRMQQNSKTISPSLQPQATCWYFCTTAPEPTFAPVRVSSMRPCSGTVSGFNVLCVVVQRLQFKIGSSAVFDAGADCKLNVQPKPSWEWPWCMGNQKIKG